MANFSTVKKLLLLAALVAIAVLPLFVRDGKRAINAKTDDTVVIITGNNENLRFEFAQGFQKWYRERTGRTVFVDWRFLGGAVETVRYLDSIYGSAFRMHWEKELGRSWSGEVQKAFTERVTDRSSWTTDVEREVCGAFYGSEISSAIDLLFGGGVSEFIIQADRGTIVDSGFLREHPELFCADCIPSSIGGEELWDRKGRWFGQSLSTFGLLYNRAALAAKGIEDNWLQQWSQLADPRLFGSVALVDPTKSSALLKAYEMVIQQQIALRRKELEKEKASDLERRAVREGWLEGLRILQLAAANTRYFADGPTKMILDVSSGNSAVGIIVDFMGNAQAAFDRSRCGWERLRFTLPVGGSAISPDPIAILRGAPNEKVAKLFLEYILGEEGQKVMTFRVGTPGGPIRDELYRPSVNLKVYAEAYAPYRTFEGDQFEAIASAALSIHPEYTAPVYNALKWTVKFALMVPHRELVEAWGAILAARSEGRGEDADRALRILEDFSGFCYDEVPATLAAVLAPSRPSEALAVQRKIVERFRGQYHLAKLRAEGR
jgi:ABC-type Fe3+ transport system substrate-binding protein